MLSRKERVRARERKREEEREMSKVDLEANSKSNSAKEIAINSQQPSHSLRLLPVDGTRSIEFYFLRSKFKLS